MDTKVKQLNGDLSNWAKIQSGDRMALKAVYLETYSDLHRYGLKICRSQQLVSDSIQDLFLNLWQSRDRLTISTSIKAYMIQSLRRKLIREMQKESKMVEGIHAEPELSLSHEEIMIGGESEQLVKNTLDKALENLTRRQREAIYLRFYSELSLEEVGEVMEVNYQSVVNYIHRAIMALRGDEDLKDLFLHWGGKTDRSAANPSPRASSPHTGKSISGKSGIHSPAENAGEISQRNGNSRPIVKKMDSYVSGKKPFNGSEAL